METAIVSNLITMPVSETISLVLLGQLSIIFLIGLGSISYLVSRLLINKLKNKKEDKKQDV